MTTKCSYGHDNVCANCRLLEADPTEGNAVMGTESGLYFYQQVINQWNKDAASVVGARVIRWYVIHVTLSRTPSWIGWHNIYRATHQLNLLEPGIVSFVNRVPHLLQRCEDKIDTPTGEM